MADVVRAALIQARWTGDKEIMTKNAPFGSAGGRRRSQGCLLPGALLRAVLLPGPGRAVLRLHRAVPDGPTTKRMQDLARETGMVLVVPMYEEEQASAFYYNTAAVIDADGTLPRQVPQDPHPARHGLLGEVLLPARATSATRCSRPPSAGSASTSATTATSPRARGRWASTGAEIVFNPRATSRGLSEYLWRIEQPAAPSPTATSSGTINRVGIEAARRRRLLRAELLLRPARPVRRRGGADATRRSW